MFVKPKFCVVVRKKGRTKLTHQIAGFKNSLYNHSDLSVELYSSCIIDSEELVNTGHLGYVVGLSFLFFFQNELVYGVVLRFCQFKGLHDLKTSLPESRTATLGDVAVSALKLSRLVWRGIIASKGVQRLTTMEAPYISNLG